MNSAPTNPPILHPLSVICKPLKCSWKVWHATTDDRRPIVCVYVYVNGGGSWGLCVFKKKWNGVKWPRGALSATPQTTRWIHIISMRQMMMMIIIHCVSPLTDWQSTFLWEDIQSHIQTYSLFWQTHSLVTQHTSTHSIERDPS